MLSYKIPWVVPALQSFVPWATNLHLSYSLLSGQDTMVAGPSLLPMTKVQKTYIYRHTFVPVDAEITSERPWPFWNGWKRMAAGEKCSVMGHESGSNKHCCCCQWHRHSTNPDEGDTGAQKTRAQAPRGTGNASKHFLTAHLAKMCTGTSISSKLKHVAMSLPANKTFQPRP